MLRDAVRPQWHDRYPGSVLSRARLGCVWPWAERQNCSAETVERLARLLAEAPPGAAEWMEPRDLGTEEASFVNRHILMLGRK